MPQLSDLRESGAIEQDADMVMFMYRPEYYDITANEFGESNKGETHIKIAKHRNGSLETIKLKALLHIQKFTTDDTLDISSMQQSHGQGPTQGGSWKPVSQTHDNTGSQPYRKLDIDPEDDAPF
jgi:replicative DNA helicase